MLRGKIFPFRSKIVGKEINFSLIASLHDFPFLYLGSYKFFKGRIMLKKLFAMSLIMAFINVHAAAPVSNLKALSSAYDKLNFALTVDWDQKDKAFHTAQMKDFKKVVMNLQKEGLTNSEILKFAQSKIKNEKVSKDLESLFKVIEINKLTDEEARDFIIETVKKNSSQGSSWLGSASSNAFLGLLIVLAIVLALSSDSNGGSHGGGYYENCYDDYVCWETCYSYPYYYCSTDCGWETSCY